MTKKTTWVYAWAEMKYMKIFHNFKWLIFLPIIKILNKIWITANMITIFGWLIAFISFLLSYYFHDPIYFAIWIWLHIFFDWIDWVMARYNNSMSDYWSLLDVIFDHLWILLTSIFLLIFFKISSIIILLYTIFYTIIIYNSFILGQINIPYKFVLRPRLFVYTTIVFDLFYSWFEITNYLIIILTIILWIQSIQWLMKLLKYFSNK
jgi:phosphatidylglycerophosphate synthase